VRDVNVEQFLKHFFPMDKTDIGMIKFFRCLQFSKHPFGKEVASPDSSNASIDLLRILSFPFQILKFFSIEQTKMVMNSNEKNRRNKVIFYLKAINSHFI
jgi:hypothetical protein